jgi:hypothetical protein
MRGPTELFDALCEEFQSWCSDQGLPQMSADELIHEDINPDQRRYLSDFIVRWEAAEAARARNEFYTGY